MEWTRTRRTRDASRMDVGNSGNVYSDGSGGSGNEVPETTPFFRIEHGSKKFNGQKKIGLFGSVMLLMNTLASPTISVMPNIAQKSGFIPMMVAMLGLALICAVCGILFIKAIQRLPGNEFFEKRVEYADVLNFYLPRPAYVVALVCYFGYLILTLVSYIIQTAQVIDYFLLDVAGCGYALELGPQFGFVCGTDRESSTPFGHMMVVSAAHLGVVAICLPMAWLDLDDNIWAQAVAMCLNPD